MVLQVGKDLVPYRIGNTAALKIALVDVSDIFNFFCSAERKGVRGARKGVGGSVLC